MNDELIGFCIGLATIFFSVIVVLLFHTLTECANKRRTKKDQSRKSHASKTTTAIKAKHCNAKKPCDEDGSGASGSQIYDNVFEKHKTPNA